ncbi:hypothetical protein Syun_023816 [Stephania yunnanensis]|uniref:non-specific serine/threonine protein kinase n=1 Tax=Stephania yunnanensis TaxID=152371 RepID=A0AAP0I3N5_9MAGN
MGRHPGDIISSLSLHYAPNTMLNQILDQRLPSPEGQQIAQDVDVVVRVAISCVNSNPTSRPTMPEVVSSWAVIGCDDVAWLGDVSDNMAVPGLSRNLGLSHLDLWIDYGVVERVVMFVKPNGKTLDDESVRCRGVRVTRVYGVVWLRPERWSSLAEIAVRGRCDLDLIVATVLVIPWTTHEISLSESMILRAS